MMANGVVSLDLHLLLLISFSCMAILVPSHSYPMPLICLRYMAREIIYIAM